MAAYMAEVALPDQATARALSGTSAAVAAASDAALREVAEATQGLQRTLNANCQRADELERGLNRHGDFQLCEGEAEALSEARRAQQRLLSLVSMQASLLYEAEDDLAAAQSSLGACLGEPGQAALLVGPAEARAALRACHAAGASIVGAAAAARQLLRTLREVPGKQAALLDLALARLRLMVRVSL